MPSSHPFTARDDNFHTPTDDIWFTETSWFAFIVPERKLAGWLYGWVRPNMGTAGGGVFIWDPSGTDPWEVPYFNQQFSQPLPAERDLRDFSFPMSYSVKMLEPLKRYKLHYQNRKLLTVDLEYNAVMEPHPFAHGEPPFTDSPHLDQLGRVTGEIVLRGERIAVDHIAIRDRSWGARPDHLGGRIGYTYAAASEKEGFCVFAQMKEVRDGWERINHGFLLRDGHKAQVSDGWRRVTRDPHTNFITAIELDIVDVEGRKLQSRGDTQSRMTLQYPRGLTVNSLLRWNLPGGEGWGEDQDCWRFDQWREALMKLKAADQTAAAR
jgi:hypothetical protein